MNSNVGENIKNHAKSAFKIGVISIIIFAVLFAFISIDTDFEDAWYVPLLIAPFAISAQWTLCLFIYGFGQLIENTRKEQDAVNSTAINAVSTQPQNNYSVQSVVSKPVVSKPEAKAYDIKVGVKVVHKVLGSGTITEVSDKTMTICFADGTTKTFTKEAIYQFTK